MASAVLDPTEEDVNDAYTDVTDALGILGRSDLLSIATRFGGPTLAAVVGQSLDSPGAALVARLENKGNIKPEKGGFDRLSKTLDKCGYREGAPICIFIAKFNALWPKLTLPVPPPAARQPFLCGLSDRRDHDQKREPPAALTVVLYKDNTPCRWGGTARHNLTYRIKRSTFTNPDDYEKTKTNVRAGAQHWMDICDVQFTHKEELDDKDDDDSAAKPLFTVVQDDSLSADTLALAFFPSSRSRLLNLLKVNRSLFDPHANPYNLDGVFAHELGHILGFLHEHDRTSDGDHWYGMPLSGTYAERQFSVMSYPHLFAGWAAGKDQLKLSLSKSDIVGAKETYGAAAFTDISLPQ